MLYSSVGINSVVLVIKMPVVLFIILYMLVLIISLWILCLTFQMKIKVTEEYVKPYMEAPCFCFADLC